MYLDTVWTMTRR